MRDFFDRRFPQGERIHKYEIKKNNLNQIRGGRKIKIRNSREFLLNSESMIMNLLEST